MVGEIFAHIRMTGIVGRKERIVFSIYSFKKFVHLTVAASAIYISQFICAERFNCVCLHNNFFFLVVKLFINISFVSC